MLEATKLLEREREREWMKPSGSHVPPGISLEGNFPSYHKGGQRGTRGEREGGEREGEGEKGDEGQEH